MSNPEYGGSDVLSEKDLLSLERNQEEILDGLYKKVRESDAGKAWLNTELGIAFRKFLAADKLRTMTLCSTEIDPTKQKAAQIGYAAVCKLEVIFGSIIADGIEALNQLNVLNGGDSHEQE